MKNNTAIFDLKKCVKRNKNVAIALFGERLDKDRNIIGTELYFDKYWRLRKRRD